MSGEHAYRIADDGLHVFPRLAERLPTEQYEMQSERMSSDIPAIDEMLADGYWPGASTIIAGPSGSGKTLMGLHFIFNSLPPGSPESSRGSKRTQPSSIGSSKALAGR
jgi:circadian clock protein KaiC